MDPQGQKCHLFIIIFSFSLCENWARADLTLQSDHKHFLDNSVPSQIVFYF